MEIPFIKTSPTQNITVLVNAPVPRSEQPVLAARLLACDSVGGEQAGFIEPAALPGARLRLQMMGGEFCGNATMSLGAWLARQDGLPDGGCASYVLEVSGTEGLTGCHIERSGDAYRGTVCMPLPERITAVTLNTDAGPQAFPMVRMPGIAHIVAPTESGLTREEIARRIRSWNETIRADALGVLRYDAVREAIEPIVYVPATDSAVWERGCGSGTAALGCWRALRDGQSIRTVLRQPGGEIEVNAAVEDNAIVRLTITGTVRIVATGSAYL